MCMMCMDCLKQMTAGEASSVVESDINPQTAIPTAPPIIEPTNGTLIIFSPAFAKAQQHETSKLLHSTRNTYLTTSSA